MNNQEKKQITSQRSQKSETKCSSRYSYRKVAHLNKENSKQICKEEK